MKVTTIFGPPGTGKTRTLVTFAEQEGQGLFLSYTRAAAAEATSRLDKRIRPSTLHSLAFNGLGMNRAAVVDKDKLGLFAKASGIPFKGSERGSDEEQEGDEYKNCLSYARNMMFTDVDQAYEHFGCPGTRDKWRKFVQEYDQWKQAYGYMDFDDMLTLYTRQGKGFAEVVYLDEAQDCTPLQWTAFHTAIQKAERVFVAGDDDQAIYEWNGADPHGMINFNNANDGDIIVLEQSHRLTEPVLLNALAVIETIEKRVAKNVRDRGPGPKIVSYRDLDFIIDRIASIAPKGALLLMRDRFKLAEMKRALNREMIPYDVYGDVSPWTSKIATAIKAGEIKPTDQQIPIAWRDFYRHADLSQPIKYHLSTIHGAKGREHETVILDLDCPTRVLANIARDRDAEVRVQYVGLTRSKSQLIICGTNPIV